MWLSGRLCDSSARGLPVTISSHHTLSQSFTSFLAWSCRQAGGRSVHTFVAVVGDVVQKIRSKSLSSYPLSVIPPYKPLYISSFLLQVNMSWIKWVHHSARVVAKPVSGLPLAGRRRIETRHLWEAWLARELPPGPLRFNSTIYII